MTNLTLSAREAGGEGASVSERVRWVSPLRFVKHHESGATTSPFPR
jgi:hypothetical protein